MKTIKELRDITGLSQRQFAEKYHINYRNIQNWEQGSRKVPEYVSYMLFRLITETDYKQGIDE